MILFLLVPRPARVIPWRGGEDIIVRVDAGLAEDGDGEVCALEGGGGHEEPGLEAQVGLGAEVVGGGVGGDVPCGAEGGGDCVGGEGAGEDVGPCEEGCVDWGGGWTALDCEVPDW